MGSCSCGSSSNEIQENPEEQEALNSQEIIIWKPDRDFMLDVHICNKWYVAKFSMGNGSRRFGIEGDRSQRYFELGTSYLIDEARGIALNYEYQYKAHGFPRWRDNGNHVTFDKFNSHTLSCTSIQIPNRLTIPKKADMYLHEESLVIVSFDAIYRYDIKRKEWTEIVKMTPILSRNFASSFDKINSKLYIFDSTMFYVYDIGNAKWNFIKHYPTESGIGWSSDIAAFACVYDENVEDQVIRDEIEEKYDNDNSLNDIVMIHGGTIAVEIKRA